MGLRGIINNAMRDLRVSLIFPFMLITTADAPPHGLDPTGTHDEMPEGCPSNHDPVRICREMAEKGIILYCVGCEPALAAYKDFFMGLSHITGGQYVSLRRAQSLSKVRKEFKDETLAKNRKPVLNFFNELSGRVLVWQLINKLLII